MEEAIIISLIRCGLAIDGDKTAFTHQVRRLHWEYMKDNNTKMINLIDKLLNPPNIRIGKLIQSQNNK